MNIRRSDPMSQVSDFDIRLLRLFKSVVEAGGFSAAESVLGIGRSAISQQMSDLEQRLGLRLCQRGRAGFSLTDEGREVYQSSLQLLSALESFRTEVNGLHQNLRGELNIGLTDNLVTLPHMRITHALARLKERGPGVHINIRMIAPAEVERGVLDGGLHVGVVPQASALPGLEYHSLYSERSLLYCAVGHPLFYADNATLDDARLAQQEAIAPTFRLPGDVQDHYQALTCTASASDREGIAFLILTGRYIGYLPDHYANAWVQEGRLRALKPDSKFYDLNLVTVTRKGRRPHLVLESFLETLAATR
ncbi:MULTISPECIES: LysR family transcriptional regulator [Pseudomonas syringae group]|uniref:LysR family transcriptional regulator n=6 Tax=Pseudomonas syringae group TaxID=136849 RepID=A0A2V4Q8W2_PSESJ|nr:MULTISPECIES: LysR family transcriptional regulator [Pseudomonas syringae group]RMU67161.1 LysR family transcriptional regulator [Pseudomonas syringae pv. aptata]AVX24783.1 LysR family transcriptional regulator [Pseudomonas syringae pv. atrofaciens]AZG84863.1 LysR family transcriptional regulator [Pseudomonas syringae pv. pisi str. PP1]EPF64817.1 LysR family transcriptional regulator [Pseudomonas syringae pv. syringae SM]KPW10808.1 LysR family transcriptional regulator [Pseudomonas syringae